MISIARKNLFSEKIKFATSTGGVALSILVILAPFAVYFGSLFPSRALPLNSGGDLWIVQEGSGDLFHTQSILPAGYDKILENVDGINSASPIINRPTRVEINGEKITAAVLGFDYKNGIAGPWKMYKGEKNISNGEAIVDRSLAYINNLNIGDSIKISGENFRVAGISLETNVLVFQYIFIRNDDAARIFKQEATVNYYLLNIKNDDVEKIKNSAKNIVPNSEIKTKETIATSNEKVIKDSFLSVLMLIAIIGLFVGTAVIGITIYSTTMERAREYGVLKAIGIKNMRLYKIVLTQASIISAVGFAVGVALYLGIEMASFYLLPAVNFVLPLYVYIYVFLLAVIMSLFSSVIPIKKINSIDPAQAFKA